MKEKTTRFIWTMSVVILFLYHPPLAPSCPEYHSSHALAVSLAAQKQCFNNTAVLKKVAATVGRLLLAVVRLVTLPVRIPIILANLLYHYINPTDQDYLDWAENILSDLRKNEEKLLQLSNCTDENSIVDTLIALAQENKGNSNTLDLLDQHWEKVYPQIIKVTTELSKRVNKPSGRNESILKAMTTVNNKLKAWLPTLACAHKAIAKYGCYVELFQLCEKLSINYEKELKCLERATPENINDMVGKIVDMAIQEANSTYDSHAHKLVSEIVKLEQCLTICLNIRIKEQWTKNATDLLENLKKLATIVMVSQKYLDAVKTALSKEYWKGYAAHPTVISVYQPTITPPLPVYHTTYYPTYYPVHY